MAELMRPDHGHGPHPHRSWLHLLALEPSFEPSPGQLDAARAVLISRGLAQAAPEGGLRPGPEFARVFGFGRAVRSLPMAGAAGGRGEVRLEAGVWRCYPDPGPEGFNTVPLRGYTTACPGCGREQEFFSLRFPFADPMLGACPECGRELPLLELPWSPELPMGRMEITFGDLESRPSLRGEPVFKELEQALGAALREVHVTL